MSESDYRCSGVIAIVTRFLQVSLPLSGTGPLSAQAACLAAGVQPVKESSGRMQRSLVERTQSLSDFVPGNVAQMRRSIRPPAVRHRPLLVPRDGLAGITSSETYCQYLSNTVPNSHRPARLRPRPPVLIWICFNLLGLDRLVLSTPDQSVPTAVVDRQSIATD
jgi:hypothetical protein